MRILMVLLVVAFLAILGLLLKTPGRSHLDILLLASEYGLLLPALWIGLRSRGSGRLLVPPIALILVVFLAINLMIGYSITRDLAAGDSAAYRFQARIFQSGAVAAPAPPEATLDGKPMRAFFRFHHHVIRGENWFAQYPPGWPALLSVAQGIGLDRLANPLLAVLYLWLAFLVGCHFYDRRVATIGVLLAALSISFQHQTCGYLSHPSCGVFLLGAMYFALEPRRARNLIGALVCLALAGWIRPYTAAWVALPIVVHILLEIRANRRLMLQFFGAAAVIGMVTVGSFAAYNLTLQGSAVGYSDYQQLSGNEPVFLFNPIEILKSAAVLTRWSLQATVFYGFPFLFPLALYVLFRDSERRRSAFLLAAIFLAPVAGYSLTTLVSGTVFFGERYYYEVFYALCLLAARGIQLLLEKEQRLSWPVLGPALAAVVVMYAAHCWLYVQRARSVITPSVAVRDRALTLHEPASVVFLPVNMGRDINLNTADWPQAAAVFLEDPGEPVRADLVRALGRNVWYVLAWNESTGTVSSSRFQIN